MEQINLETLNNVHAIAPNIFVKEQPVQEYLTTSSGNLGQINLEIQINVINIILIKIAKKNIQEFCSICSNKVVGYN